jgi:hypothetical protein
MAWVALAQQRQDQQALEQERQAQAQKMQQAQADAAHIHSIIQGAVNPDTGNFNSQKAANDLRLAGYADQADKVEEAADKHVQAAAKQIDADAAQRLAARADLTQQAKQMTAIDDAGRPVPPSVYQSFVTNVAKTLGPQLASSMPTQFQRPFVDHAISWGETEDQTDKRLQAVAGLASTKTKTAADQISLVKQALGDPTSSAQDNDAILGGMELAGQVSPEIAASVKGKSGAQISQMFMTPGERASAGEMSRKPAMVNGQLRDVLIDKQGNAYDTTTRQPVDARPVPTQAMINLTQTPLPQTPVTGLRPDQATANKPDPSLGGLTPNSVYQYAVRGALTNEYPQLGRSSTDPQTKAARTAIINKAAAIADAAGTDLGTLQQEYKANSGSLNNLTKLYNATASSAGTANDNLGLAQEQSANVPRTGSPIVNHYVQWATGHTLTGNPELTKLETYIYTAAREYAKVTSGSAASVQGLTDSATKAADQLLNAAQTPEAFNAAIGAMQKDMQNVTKNQLKQIESVSGTVAKFLAKANGQEMPTAAPNKDPLGIR